MKNLFNFNLNRGMLSMAVILTAGMMLNAKSIPVKETAPAPEEQSATSSGMKAFPNPFNSVLNIRLSNSNVRNVVIDIVEINTGVNMLHVTMPYSTNMQVNTTSLHTGFYTVRVSDTFGRPLGKLEMQCAQL